MLAAAIGIDRAIERQVRRVIAGDDGFRRLDTHLGALGRWHFLIPAVVLGHRTMGGETVLRVGRGAATAWGQWRMHGQDPDAVCVYSIAGTVGMPLPFGTFYFKCRSGN